MSDQKTIMLVDDDEKLRDVISVGLEGEGFRVLTAQNGKEGLECFDKHHPDLIILDLHMPVMDGYEFYQQMRERLEKTPCPIVGLTGDVQVKSLFDEFDIDAYVTKPFDIEKLFKTVRLMLGR